MANLTSTSATPSPFSTSRWDVIVAAPWVHADRRATLEYLADKIFSKGGRQALQGIARLGAVSMSDPLLKRVNQSTGILREHRHVERQTANRLISYHVQVIDPSLIGPDVQEAA